MKRYLLLALFFINSTAFAQVKLARLFSDHVVLQRQKPIPVWGWANSGEKIKVTLAGQTQNTKAGADGKWMVKFTSLEAGGPHTMTVTAKSGTATVADILIGEVWLCSGQSNMEWPVRSANDFTKEKANAEFPAIRHFKVEHEVTLSPEKDLKAGEWKLASAETVGDFTAIGFFFAREIYQKLNVPIGILHSSWGGSQIEGWISKEGMLGNEELKNYAENLPKTWQEADVIMDKKLRIQLFKNADYIPSEADEKKYTSGDADFKSWQSVGDPVGQWDWKGLMGFRGEGYMAKTLTVPDDVAGKQTTLSLAENDNNVEVFVNGKLVSSSAEKGVRKIIIPANTWKSGENQLVLRVRNMVGNSWFGPGLMGSASDLYIDAAPKKISLSTDWKLMPSFAAKHEYAHLMNNVGTTIYNAMIAPLIPFAVRGSLWYQGETNAGRAYQYRKTFPLMINDWRRLWNDEFSFYWVQLSSFGKELNSNTGSSWAELREAQDLTLSMPKTGMAVTTDVGNPKDIHPTNKQDVAHRLAGNALKFDYGQDVRYSSPRFDKMVVDNDKALISIKHLDGGIVVKNKYGYIQGFEIAGEDKVFHYAQAMYKDNNLVISSSQVKNPVAVRYNWSDATEEGQVFNGEGFPLAPFRTDSWPGITVKNKFQ
jgi:sialate O-acetylesterase